MLLAHPVLPPNSRQQNQILTSSRSPRVPLALFNLGHALVDADERPVSVAPTGGPVRDDCEAAALINAIPEGTTLVGDNNFAIRDTAATSNIWANIPNRSTVSNISVSHLGSTASATSSNVSSIA
jgi:hypothetical protein